MNTNLIKKPNSSAPQEVVLFTLFYQQTITAGSSLFSEILNVENVKGFFSIQQELSGSGALKWEYLVSNNWTKFLIPENANEIATSQTNTSGDGSGNNFFIFEPEVTKYIKIKATELSGTSDITISGYLAVQ